MKQRYALLLVLLVASFAVTAQTKYQYAELIGTVRGTTKTNVSNKIMIDFGESQNSPAYDTIRTKVQTFDRMVDATNYLSTLGWELFSTYVVNDAVGTIAHVDRQHWVLRREK